VDVLSSCFPLVFTLFCIAYKASGEYLLRRILG